MRNPASWIAEHDDWELERHEPSTPTHDEGVIHSPRKTNPRAPSRNARRRAGRAKESAASKAPPVTPMWQPPRPKPGARYFEGHLRFTPTKEKDE